MHRSLFQIALWATAFHDAILVDAAPELAFPVNSQVPPVAFASQPYSFTFSLSTFCSDEPEISYTLDNAPTWLSLDSQSRTIQGTPNQADVGAANFVLNAQDGNGMAPCPVTLVVDSGGNIKTGASILPALQQAGAVSAPATLSLKPAQPFKIVASAAIFSGTSTSTIYYAVSAGNAPLPPWVQFNPATLELSGTSPTLVSPSDKQQIYAMQLIATDVPGFAEATINFQIAISYHILAFSQPLSTFEVEAGQPFQSISLRDSLTVDGSPVEDNQIVAVSSELPSWAELDVKAISISGTPPNGFRSQNLEIEVSDIFGNKAVTSINLEANGASDSSSIQSTSLTTVVRTSSTTTSSTTVLSRTSSEAPASSSTASDVSPLPVNDHTKPRHIVAIVLTTVLVASAVLLLIIILLCLRRRRRQRDKNKAQKELSDRASVHGNAPPDTLDLPPVVEEARISNDRPRQVTPVQDPKVELPWAPDSLQKAKDRLSKRLKVKNQRSIDSSWGGLLVPTPPAVTLGHPTVNASVSTVLLPDVATIPPLPRYPSKRASQLDNLRRKRTSVQPDRGSKALSHTSATSGLPKRISGAGHGGGVLPLHGKNEPPNRSSWLTTMATIPQTDTRHSLATLEAFPAPPSDDKEHRGLGIAFSPTKPSMRLVENSSEPYDSFELQRQKWYADRARNRAESTARFSNAASSHATSLSKISQGFRAPSRTVSPPIPENDTISSRLSRPSWSKWSGIGPAARAESGYDVSAPAPLFSRQASRTTRDVSMASSGQFDSALSSDSQWDDENLVTETNDAGERHWHSDADSGLPSPRLPFDYASSQEELGEANSVGMTRGARLVDKRKHISVEDDSLRRSEKSQAGSFRFI